MNYSHSDEELVRQPIGYWSWAAHSAVVHHIRANLAEFGLTQPQWWILNRVLAGPEGRRPRTEVIEILRGYLDIGDGPLDEGIDELVVRGLLTEDDERVLALTSQGRELRDRAAERQLKVRDRIHEGIDDEEYVAVLKVLQRMIHNVGGKAWHH